MMPLVLLVILLLLFSSYNDALLPFGKEQYVWKDLTETELKGWYTEQDLCMFKLTERMLFPGKARNQNCSHLKAWPRNKGCGVGMGNKGDPCYMPFISRKTFKRGIAGYTDPKATPLSDALVSLAQKNTTLVLLGDSTTRQKLQAMECAIWRESMHNDFQWIGGARHQVLPCQTRVRVYIHAKKIHADILVVSIGPNSVGCLKGGLEKADNLAGGIFENARNLTTKLMIEQKRNVLVVANIGLWYNTPDSYSKAAPPILDWLVNISRVDGFNNAVAWHETMRQHWMSTSGAGYFEKAYVDDFEKQWSNGTINIHTEDIMKFQVPNCCHEIVNHDPELDWRNFMVKKLMDAQPERQNSIIMLPFSDITKGAPDMHTCHPSYKHDCTHYCYWPTLWQPFWFMLAQLAKNMAPPKVK